MTKYKQLVMASTLLLGCANFAMAGSENNIEQLVKFLTSKELLITSKNGKPIPRSYYTGEPEDIAKYFGAYICAPENTCKVVSHWYENPYAILGRGLPPEQNGTEQDLQQAQAQIERTDMKYGVNIYDAATWQIALALAAKHNYLDPAEARQLIANELQSIRHGTNRATANSFKYGYQKSITDPEKAFTFRMVATHFHNADPFKGTEYQCNEMNETCWDYDPLMKAKEQKRPDSFFKHISTWSDWKPITGENAWAQLIGPLQAEAILNDGKVAVSSPALQNAIHSLDAFSAMQAGIGAFYYAPGGSQGNQGPIPRGEISLENNFSVLGGLQILKQVLQNTEQTLQVTEALATIDVMLNGGKTVNGYETLGLLSFFYNGGFNAKKGVFYTHGKAINPAATKGWAPDTSEEGSSLAVDINTWGTSALGAATIDSWFGEGTALNLWKNVRNKGGYFNNGKLWGVGYTLNNNAGFQPEKIMSAEWTAGAINTLRSLIEYYDKKGVDTSELKADLASMKEGIIHLRNDQYLAANFHGATPADNFVNLPESAGQAYLYASKRAPIPFGWNANTLPSTTSNAWVLMNEFNFNPFQYQGQLNNAAYATPKKVDIINGDTPTGDALPKAVTVKFTAGDLGPIAKLSLSYNQDGSSTNWISAAAVDGREGNANLPAGTKAISLAFYNNGVWSGACQLNPATLICKDDQCNKVKAVHAQWSASGMEDCKLVG